MGTLVDRFRCRFQEVPSSSGAVNSPIARLQIQGEPGGRAERGGRGGGGRCIAPPRHATRGYLMAVHERLGMTIITDSGADWRVSRQLP